MKKKSMVLIVKMPNIFEWLKILINLNDSEVCEEGSLLLSIAMLYNDNSQVEGIFLYKWDSNLPITRNDHFEWMYTL